MLPRQYFIVDNRELLLPNELSSFAVEASLSSFLKFASTAVLKYIHLSILHSKWLLYPNGMVCANANETDGVSIETNIHMGNVNQLLFHNNYVCNADNCHTWESFLIKSITKIIQCVKADDMKSDSIEARTKYDNEDDDELVDKRKKIKIAVLTTDVSIVYGNMTTLAKRVEDFINHATIISKDYSVLITILASTICGDTSNEGISIIKETISLCNLSTHIIQFSAYDNTMMSCDYELKNKVILPHVPTYISSINFTANALRCSLLIEITPASYDSADELTDSLKNLSLFSLIPSNSIHPAYIKGNGCTVHSSSMSVEKKRLSHGKNRYNKNLFYNLKSILSTLNKILIMTCHEVYPSQADKTANIGQYWALIPPASDDENKSSSMSLIQLHGHQDMFIYDINSSNDTTADTWTESNDGDDEITSFLKDALNAIDSDVYDPLPMCEAIYTKVSSLVGQPQQQQPIVTTSSATSKVNSNQLITLPSYLSANKEPMYKKHTMPTTSTYLSTASNAMKFQSNRGTKIPLSNTHTSNTAFSYQEESDDDSDIDFVDELM